MKMKNNNNKAVSSMFFFFLITYWWCGASLWGTCRAWTPPSPVRHHRPELSSLHETASTSSSSSSLLEEEEKSSTATTVDGNDYDDDVMNVFNDFVDYLLEKQTEIIQQLEDMESSFGSKATFGNDPWGLFVEEKEKGSTSSSTSSSTSGGMTRVIQGGYVIEKGACSITLIRQGILTADRASTIRARNTYTDEDDDDDNTATAVNIQAGDSYAAAALSMVLHSKSPMVPTFRSDVRIFVVQHHQSYDDDDDDDDDDEGKKKKKKKKKKRRRSLAWFGGGADLTPYYLFEDDVRYFHECYRDLCDEHLNGSENNNNKSEAATFSYESMKKACDEYFYLPARREHRGTGGIFFDDMELLSNNNDFDSLAFTKGVVETWMPSWIPIVTKRQPLAYSAKQKQWQLLRRGRYLEFNLLYDRGVKFGLANANPRVEGVMVSAPPVIAYEYCHQVEEGSNEAELVEILKQPRDWVVCIDDDSTHQTAPDTD